jgi:hypothetical protein
MSLPKIVYTPAGGSETMLTFSAPARFVPGYARQAVRHDNVSGAGIRESVLERIEDVVEIALEWIPAADLAAWQAFLDHALTGAIFAYYPDAGLSSFTNYLLEDTEVILAGKSPGQYSVRLKMRKQIT